ncbi:MAG: 2,3,4,5-tetrahydropyridine-2,6-dicarboxylate N-succinyltransferase [Buchnera aphidicola (Periphyllus lyropictus)]|uniref:2,3,4,5-tetrahydropyridine-2,6-dicarboxylate N-succinyltransferase n=1 Tax=Buchnera aphidicola TaxID=9 RepID=UPI001ECC6838|nr:2,3,4,5-tetrahydropyridine-2,6-dicarboxylate N-succinyltransferase [Buchnera aphidicola]NIH16642.1 2,3,4,5-tetrahydropyridine-2,6-dicarboxylate N-succinyltransferase [Buchnera aphidicola (Periphyllus lyropictus)]USS94552.1 2,3,4,5-tetrahydropyridine-2,6-dicarboxylate N-succinyltransferase [Buchnera aphidicola (Periphyllus lyropictus)]
MKEIKKIIKIAFENKNKKEFNKNDKKIIDSIKLIINMLNEGKIRVSEKINNIWITHQWIKKAILLFLYLKKNKIFNGNFNMYYDKIPLKYKNYNEKKFKKEKIRTVPNSIVRYGSYIEKNTILMPCFINIGAYIGNNSMIDTWSTIGSCAQIGKNVHISGGVGIGGVLEPLQNNPTIIEDNCFIGARSEIVEGVIIEKGSVISMGVFIGKSTKIYDRTKDKIYYGRVPKNSVVVPGNLFSKNKKYSLYSAIIVKKVDSKTLKKVEINNLLRNSD